jgi:vacuolar protein sorting-associated protein 33A
MIFQQKHGLFPRILGKGDHAKRLADLLLRMRSELSAGDAANSGGSFLDLTPSQSIESLIIIDREVDFPTALLTQLTYEGLLDEFFNISSNQIEVDSATIGATGPQASQASSSSSTSPVAQTQTLKRKVILDNSESLYQTVRDSNCAAIGPILNKIARRLQTTLDSRNTAGQTTAELREFVAKLPGYQAEQAALKLHTNLAEEVIKRTRADFFTRALEVQQNIAAGADPSSQHVNIEELIARDMPLSTILRLLCVYSCFAGGLRARDLDEFRHAVLHAYGPQHLLTLHNLEKMGLLITRAGAGPLGVGFSAAGKALTNYTQMRKSLCLIVDEVNESEPDDIAYVFSGYAPLSVRLAQCVLQKSYLSALQASGGADPKAAAAASAATGGGGRSGGLGWRPFEDAVKGVRGATVDETQMGEEKAVRARQMLNGGTGTAAATGSGPAAVGEGGKTVIVFFLGGVCRSEVAALRFVGSKTALQREKRKVLVCTTNVISGDGIIGEAIETRGFTGSSSGGSSGGPS